MPQLPSMVPHFAAWLGKVDLNGWEERPEGCVIVLQG